jgi:hypothetical protein
MGGNLDVVGQIGAYDNPGSSWGKMILRATDFELKNAGGTINMVLDTSGNVGIGTDNPVYKLHVNSGATNVVADFESTDGIAGIRLRDNSGNVELSTSGNDFRVQPAGSTPAFVVKNGGNVGVGTASPEADLQIATSSNAAAGGAKLLLKPNGAYGTIVNNDDLGQIAFGAKTASIDNTDNDSVMIRGVADGTWASADYPTRLEFWTTTDGVANPTERMRIDSSGNVGIGTDGPLTTLHVAKAGNGIFTVERTNKSSGTGLFGINVEANSQTTIAYDNTTNFVIGRSSDPSVQSGFSNDFIMDNSGDVGIGVTPYNDCKVTIGGTVPSYSSVLMFDNNTAGGAEFFMLASDNTWSAGAGNFYMGHGAPSSGNVDMSIDGDGYIVAKEKAFIATSSTQRANFYNSGDGAGLYKQNAYSSCGTHMEISNNAAHGWSNIYLHKSWSSGQDQRMMQFTVNTSTVVGSITVNASSTSYATSSDYRLKENVVGLTGASARVNQLNPSRFNFIADDTNTLVDGFLAHEVATVVPEAITGTHDGMKDEEYEVTPAVLDDDGNVTTEAIMGTRSVPDYQGIDQSKLVPLLTAALQEALTEIASLKTRVEALE